MSKHVLNQVNHSILVDSDLSVFGTGNPMPVELGGDSRVKPIGSDTTLNVLGGSVSSPSTYTSNSDRSYEPDVGITQLA